MRASLSLAALGVIAFAAAPFLASAAGDASALSADKSSTYASTNSPANVPTLATGIVAVQAGTIELVENDETITTPSCKASSYEAYGSKLFSTYGAPRPSERTADPSLMALDNFDPYASYVLALQEGVTTAYLPPARGRLIAGQGAVVKLSGLDERRRVLSESAMIHGAVSAEARNTPGYWKPPIPATIDIGLGVEQPQLPRTLMGAMVALRELMALAQGGPDNGEYGPGTGALLRTLIAAKKPWRMAANGEGDVRALLDFQKSSGVPLVIDGGQGTGALAQEIAKSGVSVIVKAPINPNAPGRDFGKTRDAKWPEYDVAAKLANAGVHFAIASSNGVPVNELRFAAAVASRGGLSAKAALRAITLSAAEILGVADRVGSIKVGKDADLVVFNGSPLDTSAGVVATVIDGEVSYKAYETAATVLSVDDLYVGDGEVLSPGELLMKDGKILEVGRRVGRPAGAAVVHGKAAMPGMIDALGHLGLEGSSRVPATRFELKRLVEPGDATDKRVAQAGVTTVVLSPRGASRSGAPMMAYKPAGTDLDTMVIADPVALRTTWTERNRMQSGNALRELLAKAGEYKRRWDDYEKKKAAWIPPKDSDVGADDKKDDAKKDGEGDKKDGSDAEKKSDGDKKEGDADKKDEADKKKKSGKKGEEEPAKPLTGAWETKITLPPYEPSRWRLYVNDVDGKVTGSLRCDVLSSELIDVSGERKERKVTLSGDGTKGHVALDAEETKGKLKGKLTLGESVIEFEASQTSTEYEIAARPERRKPKEEKAKKEIKGEPKAPGTDPDLEPLRRAMLGKGAIVVGVEREDEILDCVAAFEAAGIKPILYGASDIYKVMGRVAGVLLSPRIVVTDPKTGAQKRNRLAELQAAGIRVAFHSDAEEGAADLGLMAAYAVSQGMGSEGALRALTSDAAAMYAIGARVGELAPGLDADVLLIDGQPADAPTSVQRVWVSGREVR